MVIVERRERRGRFVRLTDMVPEFGVDRHIFACKNTVLEEGAIGYLRLC